jgi:hypothetical protein
LLIAATTAVAINGPTPSTAAIRRQSAAHAMEALQVLLLDRPLRNEAHVGPRNGLADRLGTLGVVLLRLYVRLDELWCHQPNCASQTAETPRPIMSASAGLDADQARRQLGKESNHLAPP